MRDMFGADTGAISESATATPGPAIGTPQALAGVPNVSASLPSLQPTPMTVSQAADKAQAKAAADAQVAADPQAVHAVNLAASHPNVLGATGAGALVGSAILPGPGTLIGAAVGFLSEKYQIAGGPVGKILSKGTAMVKSAWQKAAAPGTLKLPHLTAPAPASSTAPAPNLPGQMAK